MVAMQTTPWLVRQPGVDARMRLYCFSYAGGSAASYAPWRRALHPAIELCAVQLPGRGARFGEAPYTDFPELVRELGASMGLQDDLPFAFFGHSLGGLVAFELARHCRQLGYAAPQRLIVSGCEAPRHGGPSERLHELPDDDFIEALGSYNGTPQEILRNQELMSLLLPGIRADFALAADYRYQPGPPLPMPITVLAGRQDHHTKHSLLDGWHAETTSACQIRWFHGDHFFIDSERQSVLDRICSDLLQTND